LRNENLTSYCRSHTQIWWKGC